MINPGYPFLFGVYGKRPTHDMVSLLKRSGACGILLLARNIETPEQTRALTQELTQRLGRPLLFAVDHEGGWVLRFKKGLTAFPGNAALGKTGNEKLSYAVGRQMALELSRLGIGLNLAPVLDVATAKYNPGLGIRSFGRDPKLVARMGAAFILGLQENGVSACAKHFPGKGAATVDAHVELATIRLERRAFEQAHLYPFKTAVQSGVDCVMTSHVRFPALDGAPATFSSKITHKLLRQRLGFKGVVISDDLCMGAVTQSRPVQTAAVEALKAGHDLLIIAHDLQAQRESAELLAHAIEDRLIDRQSVKSSCRRIADLIGKRRPRQKPCSAIKGESLCRQIAEKSIEAIREGTLKLPLKPNGKAPLLLVPDFAEVQDRFTFEGGPRAPERLIKDFASGWGPARLRRAPVKSNDIRGLEEEIRKAPRILFFCFEAMRFPGQNHILKLLMKWASDKTAVCLIRNPWDLNLIKPGMTVLDAYGYRHCQLRAALGRLLCPGENQ